MHIYTYLCILAFSIDVISKTTEIRPSFDIHIHFFSLSLTSSIQVTDVTILLVLTRLPIHFYQATVAIATDDGMYLLIGKYLIEQTKIMNLRLLVLSSFIIILCKCFVQNDSYICIYHTRICLSIQGHRITKQQYQIQE